MTRKRILQIILIFTSLFIILRIAEYGIDYFVGDNDGKISTKGIASILQISYFFLVIAPLLLIVLKLLQSVEDRYHLSGCLSVRLSAFSEKTVKIAIGIAAIVCYVIQRFALPLSYGRDANFYLTYYAQYFLPEPVYHNISFASPLPAFFWGAALQFGGAFIAEVIMAVGYAAAMLAIYRIGQLWNRNTALLNVGLLLCYPSYAFLYHRIANTDMLFSLGFLLWCSYLAATVSSPSQTKFVLHGLMFALLTLIRPTAQVFLVVFAMFILLLPHVRFSRKLRFVLSTVISYAIIILLLSGHNYLRYGEAGGRLETLFPFYRLFIYDKIIHPENGPYSRALTEAITTDLLPKEPYKSYEITIEKFFSSPYNARMYGDLPCLSDRVWGWDADYKIFRDVAWEAITAHPEKFLTMTLHFCYHGFWRMLEMPSLAPPSSLPRDTKTPASLNAKGLPILEENQEIPRPYMSIWTCSPDFRMTPDPDSVELKLPIEEQKKVEALRQSMEVIFPELPLKESHRLLTIFFNRVLSLYPRILYCVALSILGYIFFHDCRQREFTLFWIMAFMTVCATYTMTGTYTLEYRVTFDPIFLLGGVVAIKNFISYGIRFIRETK